MIHWTRQRCSFSRFFFRFQINIISNMCKIRNICFFFSFIPIKTSCTFPVFYKFKFISSDESFFLLSRFFFSTKIALIVFQMILSNRLYISFDVLIFIEYSLLMGQLILDIQIDFNDNNHWSYQIFYFYSIKTKNWRKTVSTFFFIYPDVWIQLAFTFFWID